MTFTAVGSFFQATATTFTLTPGGVGHLVLFAVENPDTTVWCTKVSSSNVTWTQMGSTFTGTTNARSIALFAGKVTSTSAQTVTLTFSGTPTNIRAYGQEFSSTVGSWSLDSQAYLDGGGTATWPSLTPRFGAGELYFGLGINASSAVAGSTSGYTYDVLTPANGGAYNPACPNSATAPTWGDSTQIFGTMVLVREGGPAAQLTLDATSPPTTIDGGPGSSGTTPYSFTSNSFTPPAGSIIVVTYETGAAAGGVTYDTSGTYPQIADSLVSHLTWNQVAVAYDNSASPNPHRLAVWWAYAGATSPGSMTVTGTDRATAGQISTGGTIAVKLWDNANTAAPIGTLTSADNSGSVTTLSVTLTPTVTGSALFLAATGDGTATSVAGAGMIVTDTSGAHYIQEWPGNLTTSLSPVTLTQTVGTASEFQYIGYEVLPVHAGRNLAASQAVKRSCFY